VESAQVAVRSWVQTHVRCADLVHLCSMAGLPTAGRRAPMQRLVMVWCCATLRVALRAGGDVAASAAAGRAGVRADCQPVAQHGTDHVA